MDRPLPLPSGDTDADRFARELATLIGPAYQAADGTLVAEDLRVLGQGLADGYATQARALDQAFPDTVSDLMPEWEVMLGLDVDAAVPLATRQANLVAKWRARLGGQPERILAAVRALEPTATLRENTVAAIHAINPRFIFLFAIVIPAATWATDAKRRLIESIVEQMEPAHAQCSVTVTTPFRFGDPASLFGRDAFGA